MMKLESFEECYQKLIHVMNCTSYIFFQLICWLVPRAESDNLGKRFMHLSFSACTFFKPITNFDFFLKSTYTDGLLNVSINWKLHNLRFFKSKFGILQMVNVHAFSLELQFSNPVKIGFLNWRKIAPLKDKSLEIKV